MSTEVTLEHLEALIHRDDREKPAAGVQNLNTDLSALTAAMFGIAGSIGAKEEDEVCIIFFVLFLFLFSHKRVGCRILF